MAETRIENDSLGEVEVPAWAYWGAQTERARQNFNVSGIRVPDGVITALVHIKRCAAEVNRDLGLLDPRLAGAIVMAAEEITGGEIACAPEQITSGNWHDHFPLDVFQTGSGTSTNMNVNEVLANRGNEILGSHRGANSPLHPNDHVNLGQSSNDIIPTAIHLAVRCRLDNLHAALRVLHEALSAKADEFADVVKIGRTHLQDAVPMTLGHEFSGYATQIANDLARVEACFPHLEELALGGTAVGTGINAHPQFATRVISTLARDIGIDFRPAPNRFEALAARDALVALMGALNTLAVGLMKIANDLRLLSSGPRAGFGEIRLPELQPGSSIMPGKVNPVVLEMVAQVAAQVMGHNVTVSIGGQQAPLELNMAMPLIAYDVLQSVDILERAITIVTDKCVLGITADVEHCAALAALSPSLVTALVPRIGYDRAARVAQQAYRERRTVRDVVVSLGLLSAKEADEILDPKRMIGPKQQTKPAK